MNTHTPFTSRSSSRPHQFTRYKNLQSFDSFLDSDNTTALLKALTPKLVAPFDRLHTFNTLDKKTQMRRAWQFFADAICEACPPDITDDALANVFDTILNRDRFARLLTKTGFIHQLPQEPCMDERSVPASFCLFMCLCLIQLGKTRMKLEMRKLVKPVVEAIVGRQDSGETPKAPAHFTDHRKSARPNDFQSNSSIPVSSAPRVLLPTNHGITAPSSPIKLSRTNLENTEISVHESHIERLLREILHTEAVVAAYANSNSRGKLDAYTQVKDHTTLCSLEVEHLLRRIRHSAGPASYNLFLRTLAPSLARKAVEILIAGEKERVRVRVETGKALVEVPPSRFNKDNVSPATATPTPLSLKILSPKDEAKPTSTQAPASVVTAGTATEGSQLQTSASLGWENQKQETSGSTSETPTAESTQKPKKVPLPIPPVVSEQGLTFGDIDPHTWIMYTPEVHDELQLRNRQRCRRQQPRWTLEQWLWKKALKEYLYPPPDA